jgi:hypothetical protein
LAAGRCSPSFSSWRAGMVERIFSPTVDRTCWSAGHGFLLVASTVPRPHVVWSLPVGICEGPCVPATATYQHAWVETQDCCGCAVYYNSSRRWLASAAWNGPTLGAK